jgi:hypothetical protein
MSKFPAPVWLNPNYLLEEVEEGQACGVAECFLQHPRQGNLEWQTGMQKFISIQESESRERLSRAKGMEEGCRIMVDSLSLASGKVAVQKKVEELKKGAENASDASKSS